MAGKLGRISRAAAADHSHALIIVRQWENGLQRSPRDVFEFSHHFGQMPPLPQLARGN